MHLFDYVDAQTLSDQIASGMIKEQAKGPLRILNYTAKAQYSPELWNEVTDKCRGLIYDAETFEIVARSFVKFWNYADSRHPETMPDNLPTTEPSITKKYDGSLGILYRDSGRFSVATRGSFCSEQAMWANRWLQEHPLVNFPIGYTPIVEIIYPENQVVVRYGWSGLVLLAAIDNQTGEELPLSTLRQITPNGWRCAEEVPASIGDCVAQDKENEEGYVVSWPRNGTWPLRVKIKMSTYCALHKLLTQTNPITIWELLRSGKNIEDFVHDSPLEFRSWALGISSALSNRYKELEMLAKKTALDILVSLDCPQAEHRKQFALRAVQQPLAPALFAILDQKDYSQILWKMIRPKGEQPFRPEE